MHTTPSSIHSDDRVVLISCYEMGQEPLGLAVPAGVLGRAGERADIHAGVHARLMDLSVHNLDEALIANALFVGISVPMHTALRLGVVAARRVRSINPAVHICFYGLYAELNADALADVADSCLGAEFEMPLVTLVRNVLDGRCDATEPGRSRGGRSPNRSVSLLPDRSGLIDTERYARLAYEQELHRVGYTQSTRGCKHLCRHCPLPPVYDGAFYAIPPEDVLADIGSLVSRGARHITFADPDFLNGPTHARRIGHGIRERFPGITFDYTAKIEHLRHHGDLVEELQDCGNLFVVSAVESLNDDVLTRLAKGHTRSDVFAVFRHFARIRLALRPTFVPFTPWETLESYVDLLITMETEGLVEYVDPVQYSIRLLVPPGSLLIDSGEIKPFIGTLDTERFTWNWTHPDPDMDALQKEVARIAAAAATESEAPECTFRRLRDLACERAGRPVPTGSPQTLRGHAGTGTPPRLTEAWFC